MRQESDTFGSLDIDDQCYYGLSTARSLKFFGDKDQLSHLFIVCYAQLKKACAIVNHQNKSLGDNEVKWITQACDEIIAGKLSDQFPVTTWQTGSGTQTNMNLNEVIANRANEIAGQPKGTQFPIHPNNHVNMSQSTNDTFPTVMHMASVTMLQQQLQPSLDFLIETLTQKSQSFTDIIKIGRTHLQDATPLTLAQEFSGYIHSLQQDKKQLLFQLEELRQLAIGGTAVGTGINAPANFSEQVCQQLCKQVALEFKPHPNKFSALSNHNECVALSGALKRLACTLMKLANDIRWLASGPRCGIGELNIPANEAGSSIMPGKVNPTQAEALSMVTVQVVANDAAIAFAGTQGNFELNVFKPVIIHNLLHSMTLLTNSMKNFCSHCLKDISANEDKIHDYLYNSLMLVTALSPVVGYDKASQIAKLAHEEKSSLKEACLKLGFLSEEAFDEAMKPETMTHPSS